MKRQSQKNSTIQGFMVLRQLGGTEVVKEYILQDKKKVTFSQKNPLHLFILSLVARERQVLNLEFYKTDLMEEYGIYITKNNLEKMLTIPTKVIKRKESLLIRDILQAKKSIRLEHRKKLFRTKMKDSVLNLLKAENKKMVREKERRIGYTKVILQFKTNLGTEETLVGFINNGKVEIRREQNA